MKNFVVVGGGTAGWITALYMQKSFPDKNITLIESSEIGILGAGEGSTPSLIAFFDWVGIPVSEIIKNTGATLKSGIKFTNWSGDNKFYYHGFPTEGTLFSKNLINSSYGVYDFPRVPISYIIDEVENPNNVYKNETESFENNKVPFVYGEGVSPDADRILHLNRHAGYSLHFDARKMAVFLEGVGKSRGIKVIDAKVNKLNSDKSGNITSIELDNNKIVISDFVFDCSGFARLIIGKHFNSEWTSFSDKLPMKKAIPFFLDIDKENIPPYTEAIAMKYGWMWKIPLQHRYGCGYVFDSDFISEEDAKLEIENFLGHTIESPKTFSFNPGSFNKVWINNCLAVGLSAGFVEPLEATAIWQLIKQLRAFTINRNTVLNPNQEYIDIFNEKNLRGSLDVVDFLYLHYYTERNDTDFWKNFNTNNIMPDTLKRKLCLINNSVLENEDCGYENFESSSYYQVAIGNKIISKENLKNIYTNNYYQNISYINKAQQDIQKNISKIFMDHSEFLRYLGGLSD
jgi:tryptophan halogenase